MAKTGEITYIKAPRIFGPEDNALTPLPPDYESLTTEGQRLARVNACSIWRAKKARPEHLVASWHFFTQYYLHWDEALFFELSPGQEKPLRTPDFHHLIVRSLAEWGSTAAAAPRGGAKSTVVDQEILHIMFTTCNFSMTLMLAVGRMIQKRFSKYKFQILENRRLLQDFGHLAPSKGESPFMNQGLFILRNRVTLEGIPMDGRARGARPGIFFLDDPEYDPEGAATDMAIIRRQFARTLFKVIVPMMRRNCPIQWLGTVISKQHMMWLAWSGQDPRFGSWHRILLPAILESGEPLWPEWKDTEEIDRLRRQMGDAAVDAEFFNMPGESEGSTFHFEDRRHVAYIDQTDFNMEEGDPWKSNAIILQPVFDGSGNLSDTRRRIPVKEWLGGMARRFLFIDAAVTTTAESDYTAIVVVGVDGDNILWVLDAHIARINQETQIDKCIEMALKWKCLAVCAEDVSIQKSLNERISTRFIQEAYETDVVPAVLPIKPPSGYTKTQRISGALRWRFDNNLILLPGWKRYEPSIQALIQQIDGFNDQMEGGGLSFIDGLDALAYCQLVIRGRVAGEEPSLVQGNLPTIIEKLERGEYVDEAGNDIRPMIFSLPNVPKALFEKVLRDSEPAESINNDPISGATTHESRF